MIRAMRLDTESLRALKLVAEVGGVTEAAAHLCLSQSAVSWKLRRLEERVGHTLLHRDGRTLRPTVHGRELIAFAERILAAHDAAVERLRGSAVTGSVRLAATDDLAVGRLAEIAGRFRDMHPDVHLQIRVDASLAVADLVDAGEVDLGLMPVESGGLREGDVRLWHDDLVFVQAADRAFPESEPLPLVTFGPRCFYGRIARQWLNAAGVTHVDVLQSASIAGVRAALSAGFGVALMNRGFMSEDHRPWPGPRGMPVPPGIEYVLRAAREPLSDAARTLADELHGPARPATRQG
jgi:DNA-binding transcriptional LysR family regulator